MRIEPAADSPAGETWGLAAACAANQRGSRTPHTVVLLPSYSVAESLLTHYSEHLLQLEHRQLLHLLALNGTPGARLVFVTSKRPAAPVVDYYLSLLPRKQRRGVRSRLHFLEVPDPSPRSVTAKLLDRPDLVAELRHQVRGRIAFIEPWNVTDDESRLAHLLGVQLHGTPAALWPLGFKSSGRRILRAVGVPLPVGREDVRSVDEVVAAVDEIVLSQPTPRGVVVKLDNSGAGDGVRIIPLAAGPVGPQVRAATADWEPWFVDELSRGGVVEELVAGPHTTFPSVQVDIAPTGDVEVVSTHEQVIGGSGGLVYLGCRLPAEPAYAGLLAGYGAAVGRVLADRGALGRLSVDFVAVNGPDGGWRLHGLEINLRKTGTTHPLAALANLVPGRYHPIHGRWQCDDGSERCYRSTDSLAVPRWRGAGAEAVIDAVEAAGLQFDRRTGTGLVLHSLCGLEHAGRVGLTAIGSSPDEAERLWGEGELVLGGRERPGPAAIPLPRSPAEGEVLDAGPA